jgi:6-pyruvoyltetrahydropterin/6-carboxytetrahydropterin synthase
VWITKATLCDDASGMVCDFDLVKGVIGTWIEENWDHTVLVGDDDTDLMDFCYDQARKQMGKRPYIFSGPPTVENIAMELATISQKLLDAIPRGVLNSVSAFLKVCEVTVRETPTCSATYSVDEDSEEL